MFGKEFFIHQLFFIRRQAERRCFWAGEPIRDESLPLRQDVELGEPLRARLLGVRVQPGPQLHTRAQGGGGGGQRPLLLSHVIWLQLASLPQVCHPPPVSAPPPSLGRRWGRTAAPPPPPHLVTARQSSSGMPPSTCSQLHPRAQGGGGGGQRALLLRHLIWLQLASLPQVCNPPPVLSSTPEPREEVGEDSGLSSSATSSGYSSPVFLRYATLHLFSAPPPSPTRRWGRTAAPPPPPHLAPAHQSSSGMPPSTCSQLHTRAQGGGGGGQWPLLLHHLIWLRLASPGRRLGRTAVPPPPQTGLATAHQSSSGMPSSTCSQLHPRA